MPRPLSVPHPPKPPRDRKISKSPCKIGGSQGKENSSLLSVSFSFSGPPQYDVVAIKCFFCSISFRSLFFMVKFIDEFFQEDTKDGNIQ